jgi:3-dehydroquinate dehydratase type I
MPSRPRIIGVLTASNLRDEDAWRALADCDMAEFRADTWLAAGREPGRILSDPLSLVLSLIRPLAEARGEARGRLGRDLPFLLTLRLVRDGGHWPDEEADRRRALWRALSGPAGKGLCDWVDLELEEAGRAPADLREALASAGMRILISHHDFQRCPSLDELHRMRLEMQAFAPDGVKFAVTCRDRAEVLRLVAFAREVAAATPWSGVFSMGEPGRPTRLLGPLLGCPFTYGHLSGQAVAPGLIGASRLKSLLAVPAPPDADPETLLNWAEGRLQEAGLAR